ncbi:hypothetical protein [Paenibacillus donghaensis]|uniref:Uncharacterized protein n=1 Tax=Paenibacillus donghaensis TaxID=414771 RepID=A0A2Z2K9K1_9BACL|nr:hypothetical protein [Paenibacillus donghaensis]ASA22107.1 hypothetical protein B9T62_15765 [Paenibacillus donghaensis]
MDMKLYEEYPRVAASAEALGFKYEDVKVMIQAIEEDQICVDSLGSRSMYEIGLKQLIVRMDTDRDNFPQAVVNLFNEGSETIREKIGVRTIPVLLALFFKFQLYDGYEFP